MGGVNSRARRHSGVGSPTRQTPAQATAAQVRFTHWRALHALAAYLAAHTFDVARKVATLFRGDAWSCPIACAAAIET